MDAASALEEGFRRGLNEMLSTDTSEMAEVVEQWDPVKLVEAGRRAAELALTPFLWDARLGPMIETGKITELLDITRQAVAKAIDAGRLIGLPAGRTRRFPVWRLNFLTPNQGRKTSIRPEVAEIVAAFKEAYPQVSPLHIATWAMTPQPELKEQTPSAWLERGLTMEPLSTRPAGQLWHWRSNGGGRQLPALILQPERMLYRIHRAVNDPIFFDSTMNGRFSLCDIPGRGTCHTATSSIGAYVEGFGRFGTVSVQWLEERSLSELALSRPLRLVDLTDRTILGRYGIAGDISAGTIYEPCQRLASDLYALGFDRVYYTARHDPAFSERSVAIFGGEGDEKLFIVTTDPIPDEVVTQGAQQFGLSVLA